MGDTVGAFAGAERQVAWQESHETDGHLTPTLAMLLTAAPPFAMADKVALHA